MNITDTTLYYMASGLAIFALSLSIVYLKAIMDVHNQRKGKSHIHPVSLALFTIIYCLLVLVFLRPNFQEVLGAGATFMGAMQLWFDPFHNFMNGNRNIYAFNETGDSWFDRNMAWTKRSPMMRWITGGCAYGLGLVLFTESAERVVGFNIEQYSWGLGAFILILWLWVVAGQTGLLAKIWKKPSK